MIDPQPAVRKTKRRAWLAFLLSLLAPGLGQIYNGYGRLGMAFFIGDWAAISLAAMTLTEEMLTRNFWLVAIAFAFPVALGLASMLEAAVSAYSIKEITPDWFNRLPVYAGVFLMSFGVNQLAVSMMTQSARPFETPTASMVRTLMPGDHVLALAVDQAYRPVRGDIVIFKQKPEAERYFMKRVVGLPGESIDITDTSVSIDGKELEEPYVVRIKGRPAPAYGRLEIPEGAIFVMGDNRDNSADSRHFGPVKLDQVIGRAVVIYWSIKGFTGKEINWERVGTPLNGNRE